jgi:hypothetical protein
MAQLIPSPPIGADPNSYVWIDWYNQITVVVDYLNELLLEVNTVAASAATAAQDAQDAADLAQTAAETAQTVAETASTAAETAQTAAETAQTAAETAQTAADLAQALAVAAQEQSSESLSPDTYNVSSGASALFLGAGTASAEVRYNNDGTKDRRVNGGSYIGNGNWYNPTTASIGDTHWIRFTKVSEAGATISGTFGSWLQLNSARSLSISTSSGEATGVITAEIATDSGGVTIVGTGTVTLYAVQEN